MVWSEKYWIATAINNPKAPKVLPFVRSIHFKLYQAVYHLENTLIYESQAQEFRKGRHFDNARVTKYEFDSLIHALNSVADILTKLICTVYDIKTSDRIYFSTIFEEKKKKIIFEMLSNKNLVLLNSLAYFNKTEERKIVHEYCNNIKHQDALINGTLINKDNKADVFTPIKPYSGEIKLIRDLAPQLEEIHREAICKAGELIIPDLGYKRAIDFPRDHFGFPSIPPSALS